MSNQLQRFPMCPDCKGLTRHADSCARNSITWGATETGQQMVGKADMPSLNGLNSLDRPFSGVRSMKNMEIVHHSLTYGDIVRFRRCQFWIGRDEKGAFVEVHVDRDGNLDEENVEIITPPRLKE